MGPHGQENSFVLLKQGSPTPSLPFVSGDMNAYIVSKLMMAFKINNVREKGNTHFTSGPKGHKPVQSRWLIKRT